MKRISMMLILILVSFAARTQPHEGQIVIDPNHKNRLVYHNQYVSINGEIRPKPCILIGTGDPEDFFYNNTNANLELLKSKGARCTYITAFLADFGGGNPGNEQHLDSVLNAWAWYITELENANVAVVFFFFDDSYSLPDNWKFCVEKIVNKLKHHKLLIWSVAEEYKEALTSGIVSEIARFIDGIDNHNHVIGVHQNNSITFDFNNDSILQMFNIQYNAGTPELINEGLISAFNNTAGSKILNLAEVADHAKKDIVTFNRINWAAIFGGASMVQALWMGRASDNATWNSDDKYIACAKTTDFLCSTDINAMVPGNHLAMGGTKFILATEGKSYLLYYQKHSVNPGIKNLASGNYAVAWFNVQTGEILTSDTLLSQGDNYFTVPKVTNSDWVLWLSNKGILEDPVLKNLRIAPDEAFILTNQTYQFKVSGFDQYNQNIAFNSNWQVVLGGTINKDGIFSSNSDTGDFKIICYATENNNIRDTGIIHVFSEYPKPIAINQKFNVLNNGPVHISLEYSSITPGPFAFNIIVQPKNGSLTLSNNDAIYIPNPGFKGLDYFMWNLEDTVYKVASDTVKASVNVFEYQKGWYFCREGENFDTTNNVSAWMFMTDIPGYSGEGYLQATQNGTVTYNVDFPDKGNYYLYVRNYATSSENNGFHLKVDGVAITGTNNIDGVYVVKKSIWNWGTQFQYGEGDHSGPVNISIKTKGVHPIEIGTRDIGFSFDKIIITDQKINNTIVDGTDVPYFLEQLNGISIGYYGVLPPATEIAPLPKKKFNIEKDLLLAQFDCKTDVDDLHAIAAMVTLLSDSAFSKVKYHAVAGTYGIQGGLYVPPNELFKKAFDNNWTDAHENFEFAIAKVKNIVVKILIHGGDVWIAEAGQSDFTAGLIRKLQVELPQIDLKQHLHVVQHSNWNEEMTLPEHLQLVKVNSDYFKIPDGNEVGNGTPGFANGNFKNWNKFINDSALVVIWQLAIELANKYNGQEGRYNNKAIFNGGFDFSDLSEVCWILGVQDIKDIEHFFKIYSK